MPDPKKIEQADLEEQTDEATEANLELEQAFEDGDDTEVPSAGDKAPLTPSSPD